MQTICSLDGRPAFCNRPQRRRKTPLLLGHTKAPSPPPNCHESRPLRKHPRHTYQPSNTRLCQNGSFTPSAHKVSDISDARLPNRPRRLTPNHLAHNRLVAPSLFWRADCLLTHNPGWLRAFWQTPPQTHRNASPPEPDRAKDYALHTDDHERHRIGLGSDSGHYEKLWISHDFGR